MRAKWDPYLAKEREAEPWGDIQEKPATFPATAHKASHEAGGADALSLTDIGGDIKTIDYAPPSASLADGTATGGTDTTLVDTGATWVENEFAGKVCYIKANGDSDYGLIESNTETTLTFDDDLLFVPCSACEYKVLNTRAVLAAEMSPGLVLAVDAVSHEAAIVLPLSTPANERDWLHVYQERGNGNIVPVVARGTDRIFGAKYATLEAFREGMTVYAHQYLSNHWDIVSEYNVKRIASSRMTAGEGIADAAYIRFLTDANTTEDVALRFVKIEDGDGFLWWRYTSLFPKYFFINANAQITKTGAGAGELTMTVRKKDGTTSAETDSDADMTTRYGGGEGAAQISLQIAVHLSRGDEFTLVAKRTAGTVSIDEGTTFNALEA